MKNPIAKSLAPNGSRWNTKAATNNLPPELQGVCCVTLGPRGHGGRGGYLYVNNSIGLRCCERHGLSLGAVGQELKWMSATDWLARINRDCMSMLYRKT